MQTAATVIEIKGELAVVEVERESACEGCHKSKDGKGCAVCSLTGASKTFRATALNTIGARVGDRVTVNTDSGRVLWYSLLVFLVPLVVGFVFYFASGLLTELEWLRCVCLLVGLSVSFLGVYLYSRSVSKKRHDIEIVAMIAPKSPMGD